MLKEIGSEFMADSYQAGTNAYSTLCSYPKRYVLSGRTGLYLIAQELEKQDITEIALPAYCCGSMVAPFVDAGLQVCFYEAEAPCDVGAILVMDYFGYLSDATVAFARTCRERGITVIVDATQTAFSRSKTYEIADYIVVSYRKWFDCLCAAVYSKSGFSTPAYEKDANEYLRLWRSASQKKRVYCDTKNGDKQAFLDLYRAANSILAQDYIGYKAHDTEIARLEAADSEHIRSMRRANAQYLLSALRENGILLFEALKPEDCPLHVPITLPTECRTRLRSVLTTQAVYCPAHWPVDAHYPHQKTALHDTELSLVCDQRYSLADMEREAKIVLDFMTE